MSPKKTKTVSNTEKTVKAPRKTQSKTKKLPKTPKVVEEPAVSDVEEVERSSLLEETSVTTAEPTTESVVETTESVSDTEKKPRKKRAVPTTETVTQEFDDLLLSIEEEITRLREAPTKAKGVKYLRGVGKKVKTLRAHTLRIAKKRKTGTRKVNPNSGFNKPVRITKALAKFGGWDVDGLKSRRDVTKFVCDYIAANDLQNPKDRRQILVETNPKLQKLLGYDGKKDPKPLTYYSLQTYLKYHYIKDEVPK